jgi:hypothetical protein
MKVYNLNPEKSKINWTSIIGEQEIHGEVRAKDGSIIAELGNVVEGNVYIDLNTIKVTDSAMGSKEKKEFEKTLKSSPLINDDNGVVNYKFQEVIPGDEHNVLKGLLMFGKQAFGIDVIADFEQSGESLKATGKISIERSNPVLISELDKVYDKKLDDDKSLQDFTIDCELVATTSDK